MKYEIVKYLVIVFCGIPLILVLISMVTLYMENRKKDKE